MQENPYITTEELSKEADIVVTAVKKQLRLIEKGYIQRRDNDNSSWRLSGNSSANRASTLIIASFIRSASVPWIGMLMAARSAPWRTMKLLDLISGIGGGGRRASRPTGPSFWACSLIPSMAMRTAVADRFVPIDEGDSLFACHAGGPPTSREGSRHT